MRTPGVRSTVALFSLAAIMLPWSHALGNPPAVSEPARAPEIQRKDAREVRISPDNQAGSYRRLDGTTDAVHAACSTNRRQQQEPSVAVNPRNPKIIAVGTMDACIARRNPLPIPQAQNWASYYRSTDAGNTWSASLMPGYPGDPAQPLETGCVIQGDPALAFDTRGHLFYGALCPVFTGDLIPADFHIAVATFEDDGSHLVRQVRVDRAATPVDEANLTTDKPILNVDQTDGRFSGNVYVAWTECTGPIPCLPGRMPIKFARSTDQARTFSEPITLSPSGDGQYTFSDIAVGPDGAVYVTFRSAELAPSRGVFVTKSSDGGKSFSPTQLVEQVVSFDSTAAFYGGGGAYGSCGDGPFRCGGGFTFPTAYGFQSIAADSTGVHLVWNAELPHGQAKIFIRSSPDGLTWPQPAVPIDSVPVGHQFFPDLASADGVLSVLFYDSRADAAYSPHRPPGNTAAGTAMGPWLNAFVASSADGGLTWTERRLTTVASQPNYETYLDARSPWLGDYISLSAVPGRAFAVWTDLRDVVSGKDTRPDSAPNGFDVFAPCTWTPNTVEAPPTGYASPAPDNDCLSRGGLDSNIYGGRL